MSIDRCCRCAAFVDTDHDMDCYQPHPAHPVKGAPDICVCERCREREEVEAEIAAAGTP